MALRFPRSMPIPLVLLGAAFIACGDDGGSRALDGGAGDGGADSGATQADCAPGSPGCTCNDSGTCDGSLVCSGGACIYPAGDGDGDAAGDGDGDGDSQGDGDGDGASTAGDPECGNSDATADTSDCALGLQCRTVAADHLCTCPPSELPPECPTGRECGAYPGTVCSEMGDRAGYFCVVVCTPGGGTACPPDLSCVTTEFAVGPVCTSDGITPPACNAQSDCFVGSTCESKLCIKNCEP